MKTSPIYKPTWRSAAFAAAMVAGSMAAQVASAQTLPDPGIDSVQYDDFWSYSTRVLDYRDPTAGWDSSAGTGVLDILITTRSSGQQNPSPFPDPVTNENTNPIDGGPNPPCSALTPEGCNNTWGGGSTASTQMLVSDLYNYLLSNWNVTTPTFTFDQNETGGNPDLIVSAKVEIIDGFGGAVLHTWALDNTLQAGDGDYDQTSYVTAPGTICVSNNTPGDPDECFSNNVGSGHFDYIVYAPSMDLTTFADANNIFKVTWIFANVDDGGEEITMTGRFTPGSTCEDTPEAPECQVIPEPNSLALGGLALLGLYGISRRRRQM